MVSLIPRRYDAECVGVQEIELIEEGSEPQEFLDALE